MVDLDLVKGSDLLRNILCSNYALKKNALGYPNNNCGTDPASPNTGLQSDKLF